MSALSGLVPGALRRSFARAWLVSKVLLRADRGAWIEEGVLLGCAYPRTERALARLSRRGVGVLIDLDERAHDPRRLARHGLSEVHLPVADFAVPSPGQLSRGVSAITEARGGAGVAVHCSGGLGRTGTLLACYLVRSEGLGAAEAVERVRSTRPGSVETRAQEEAVEEYARRRAAGGPGEADLRPG